MPPSTISSSLAKIPDAPQQQPYASLVEALRQVVTSSQEVPRDPETTPFVAIQDIGRTEIIWARGGPIDFSIGADEITAPLTVQVLLTGRAVVRQGDEVLELKAGDLCLTRGARPLAMTLVEPFEIALVNVPEQEFAERFPLWRLALMKAIPGSAGAPAVLRDAIESLQRWRDTLGASGTQGIANALVDLVGAVVCFAVPANSDCIQRSLYQRERVKRFAQENLRNPDLSVEQIADAVKLSARQIHRLFANEPMSLMRWVWLQRLENCHRELRDVASANRSISDIAYAWGFNDQAHFSRAFRRQFGVAPREVRRQGRLDAALDRLTAPPLQRT
ncbi:transcriptional regulator containing an amidase domain and an AraC-type DNA-binding HTH domain [Thioflavicoccus mobilis 8321]|uniref:Transcriptional regulator containing an amidase domain and an AraC-type DNA-binding HTH domain n=2 Tax=Thioflavicoccus mobilis TaxID=80679 RepID=L0H1S0_9GAMM|nr:transcriptional regulator containing an amidase domain and an AraC-type DNA-binding HTH domain [Thioflavicoccus mobilis 8321]